MSHILKITLYILITWICTLIWFFNAIECFYNIDECYSCCLVVLRWLLAIWIADLKQSTMWIVLILLIVIVSEVKKNHKDNWSIICFLIVQETINIKKELYDGLVSVTTNQIISVISSTERSRALLPVNY